MNETSDSKIDTRKWDIINDQSNKKYQVENKNIYKPEALKSGLCDFNDAYMPVTGNIAFVAASVP